MFNANGFKIKFLIEITSFLYGAFVFSSLYGESGILREIKIASIRWAGHLHRIPEEVMRKRICQQTRWTKSKEKKDYKMGEGQKR